MDTCPCGLEAEYEACCGRYISGRETASTAEALMRSRYTAFARAEIDYLEQTLTAEGKKEFDRDSAAQWAGQSDWLGLEVVETNDGGAEDDTGMVEFIARYEDARGEHAHHERAEFEKNDGRWMFVRGRQMNEPVRREAPKVGRNEPCPCGSGKKFKKCCGKLGGA